MNTDLIKAARQSADAIKTASLRATIMYQLCDALEAADKRVKELEEAQRWIPCAERMPELPDDTYCSVECNVIAAGNKPFATSMYYERTMRRGKAVERWMWHDRISPWDVTHWQPLPQPPQKG